MGNVKSDARKRTSVSKVFTAGDMTRGPEPDRLGHRRGPAGGLCIDKYLMGSSDLPSRSTMATACGRSHNGRHML